VLTRFRNQFSPNWLHPLLCAGVNFSLSIGWFNLFFSFRFVIRFLFKIYTETILSLRGKAKMPLGKMGQEEAEALLRAFGMSVGSCGLANVLTTVQ